MQTEFSREKTGVRPSKALVARGGLFRTFGSLAGFFSLLLLIVGLYLLEDTFANPLTAQPAALLAAGFMLGLDAVLFYYMMKPHQKMRTAHIHGPRRARRSARSAHPDRQPAPGD
jgi:hypothetical protein